MLRVFLEHEHVLLRPLRQSLYRQFPGLSLTQAVIACRLRQVESTFLSWDRGKYQDVVRPILTQPREELSVTELKLGAVSDLYRLFREAEVFISAYSRAAWDMTQDAVTDYNRMMRTSFVRLPLSITLSGGEKEQIQMAYLLFDSYRHTLWFGTAFLQYYYYPKTHASWAHIAWEFPDENRLRNIRAFDAVLRFLLQEYNRLLCQVDDLLEGESSYITLQQRTRQFLKSSSRDNRQFPAFLCSKGYRPLLYCQEIGNATEAVVSLYMQYRQLRQNRHTCPLVAVAHLKDSFAGSQTERDYWTSGAFMFDSRRLRQLDDGWYDQVFMIEEEADYGV